MTSTSDTERRAHHQIRAVFVHACELLSPFVAANDGIPIMSNFAMAHMLQEHFPDLSSSEIHTVIITVEKIHREERIHALLNKKG